MAKYYYKKYKTKVQYRAVYGSEKYSDIEVGVGITGDSNYTLFPNTGVFTGGATKTIVVGSDPSGSKVYSIINGGESVVQHTILGRGGVDTKHSQWDRDISSESHLGMGSFIETVTAKEGTYPDNGIQGEYWYVKKGKAGLNLYPRIGGQVKQVEGGKVRIDRELKDVIGIWTRVDGKLVEV